MKGYIEVVLPKEAQGVTLGYAKVAETEALNETSVRELWKEDMEYTERITVEEGNTIRLADLEEGVYQIQAFAGQEYEFMPSLVSVPSWNEKEKEMQYEFTVIPKYTYHVREPEQTSTTTVEVSPQTGDGKSGALYGLLGIISFIIVVIISCHNRFKCGRMTHMYKKRRRT